MARAVNWVNRRKLFNIIGAFSMVAYAVVMVLNGLALASHPTAVNAPLSAAWWATWSPAYALFLFIALGSLLLSRVSRKARL